MFTNKFPVAIVVAIICFPWCQAKAWDVPNGLIGYWPFDANTIDGKTIKDASGNLNFSIKIAAGQIGDALEFGSENGHCVVTELMITEAQLSSLTLMAGTEPTCGKFRLGKAVNGNLEVYIQYKGR